MHRIDGAGHVNNMFVSEDPATNRPPTEVTPEILNAFQEEMAGVVERTGRVLNKNDNTQLGDSIQDMIDATVGDYSLDTGTANAKVVALNPAINAYTGNFGGTFKNAVANNGAVTVDFGAGAVPLVSEAGAALGAGDLPAGCVVGYQYIHADAKAYVTSMVQSQGDARYLQIANARIRLTGNTTFYVSTTGSDGNNGLSAGSPFLTIQKAANVIHETYDLNGYVATIQLADGTYTAGVLVYGEFTGATLVGSVVIQGNNGSPANVLLNLTSDSAVYCIGARFIVKNLKIQTNTSGSGLVAAYPGSIIHFSNLIFGACAGYHISSSIGGFIQAIGNYSISGGATLHWMADRGGKLGVSGATITLTGTPNFTANFAQALELGNIYCPGNTFNGGATGARYGITSNGVINTAGGGVNYLPGNAAGTTATGGQYV